MTGKRVAALMSCSARYTDAERREPPEIELPGGAILRADDPAASKRLSDELGRDVTILPIDPPATRPPAASPPAGEFDAAAEGRAMMAREGDEPLPDWSKIPAALGAFASRSVRPFVDLAPLVILSLQSLEALAAAAPGSDIDVRRFRPSLLVDLPGQEGFPEQAWIGRRLRVGDAVLSIQMTCPRCIMTTHGFADLAKDPRIMRSIVKAAEGNLGVYATVERAGEVRTAARVQTLD